VMKGDGTKLEVDRAVSNVNKELIGVTPVR